MALHVAIICGDFNGGAYRPSQGPHNTPELTPGQIVNNIKFPMCLEECQYVVDAINKDKPLSQRVGLQFRHSTSLAGTHHRPSEGSLQGLHGFDPDVSSASDTMVVMCLFWPEIAQHGSHRAWYEANTVRAMREDVGGNDDFVVSDTGHNLYTKYFSSPVTCARQDLYLQISNR